MKYLIRKAVENTFSSDSFIRFYLHVRKKPKIITYHGVFKDQREATLPWFVNIDAFEEQLKYLKRHYVNLPLSDLVLTVNSGNTVPESGVTITFDDGYENNYRYAVPLLRKYGFTATFFVCPKFVDKAQKGEKEIFWWYIIYCIINEKNCAELISIFKKYGIEFSGYKDMVSLKNRISKTLQTVRAEIYEQITADLKKYFANEINKINFPKMMDWNQLKALKRMGMGIGSHTMSHVAVSSLSKEYFYDELIKPKQELEEKLQDKIEAFAFPYGERIHCSREAVKAVKEAGYRCAFLALEGQDVREEDPFCLNRIPVVGDDDLKVFKLKVAGIYDDINLILNRIKSLFLIRSKTVRFSSRT